MSRPSERTVSMLRRAYINAVAARTVAGESGFWYAYDDGEALRDTHGRLMTTRAFCRFVREGWLLPVDVGKWRARRIDDPAIEPTPIMEDEMGRQLPSPQQTAILRRISTHKLVVSFIDSRRHYAYSDGVQVKREDAERLVRNRWVVPEDPGLFHGEEPQSYVCANR